MASQEGRTFVNGSVIGPRGFAVVCTVSLALLVFIIPEKDYFLQMLPLTSRLLPLSATPRVTVSLKVINSTNPPPVKPKLIVWDPVLYWMTVPSGEKPFAKCKVKSCYLATKLLQASKLGTPDAVIISGDHMAPHPPMKKTKGQVWIYTTHESPVTLREFGKKLWNLPTWRNIFDMTMTYSLDSNFSVPYGLAEKLEVPPRKNYTAILRKKKKLAAQVSSSHCESQGKRKEYIQLLKRHASVDIFGKCGSGRCDRKTCFNMIGETYKFYLAFENSLCPGYVTEKFFRTQPLDLVAVVRGTADYDKFFPENSYIDTRNFKSPRALAKYLNYLDRNDSAYLSYLKAKANYRVLPVATAFDRAYCKLCEYLHKPPPLTHSTFDFNQWWSDETSCKQPTDLVAD